MAHLVYPPLERADPAEYEGGQQIVTTETSIQELGQDPSNELGFSLLGWAVPKVLLGHRGLDAELGQVEGVAALSALHVEERPLPLLHRIQPLDAGKDRVLSR